MGTVALRELGMGVWNDPSDPDDKFGGETLMLFPGEWYSSIPAGFVVTSIANEDRAFVPGETSEDVRFGYLAYGVKVRA